MSTFGKIYRVCTFGESHSLNVGCVIEGFPSNFSLSVDEMQGELNRRRPGQSLITTSRDEKDKILCVSGMEKGKTLGSPLCFMVANENIRKKDYLDFAHIPRPGHADFTYLKKYGIKSESGGGRSSARETIGRVIAGAAAKQFLKSQGILFSAYVSQISDIKIPAEMNARIINNSITNEQIEELGQIVALKDGSYVVKTEGRFSIITMNSKGECEVIGCCQNLNSIEKQKIRSVVNIRCPFYPTAIKMLRRIEEVQGKQDSVGGVVSGIISGMPVGLGEPCFDKFPALIAHSMMSLPATKGFEYGSGFDCVNMLGSRHNDKFNSDLSLKTNYSGGTLGGITTGSNFEYRVAFKPVSSIAQPQQTHDFSGSPVTLETKGRHDPCVLPRAPAIVDNSAAMVVMDLWLRNNAQLL